jgi:hypothetical protein
MEGVLKDCLLVVLPAVVGLQIMRLQAASIDRTHTLIQTGKLGGYPPRLRSQKQEGPQSHLPFHH